MEAALGRIVIVGGGTAGWLAACRIAARAKASGGPSSIKVTLIESPEIPTIGVGEGSWPTLRRTLQSIGISEAEFLAECDASFKQGTRFVGWRDGNPADVYYHPFTPPVQTDPREAVAAWHASGSERFDTMVSPQPLVCASNLAPRKRGMPDYSGALNYGYHLDATKLAALLARHATERLGVRHVRDHVTGFDRETAGGIAAVRLREGGDIAGDLFVDCTGHAALVLGGELGVPFVSRADILPNDRALAVQVAVEPGSPIASQTDSTAHDGGWIWDIGLPGRRGVGCVYASAYMSDDAAALVLDTYLARTAPDVDRAASTPRLLSFRPGHRERFWEHNCLAIGQSAGFLEPLEASAIVMIELSIDALLDGFPATREAMPIHARRFNDLFLYRWNRIVEFLKLHYVLSERGTAYWEAHRDPQSIPARLGDLLALWRGQAPSRADFPQVDEVFPAASYQYVLYGMGAPPPAAGMLDAREPGGEEALARTAHQARVLVSSLPTNREYLQALRRERGAAGLAQAAC